MDSNNNFDLHIGHIFQFVMMENRSSIPYCLKTAFERLIFEKKIYLPLDELIKRYAENTKEDLQLLKNNLQKYRAKKINELNEKHDVQLIYIDEEKGNFYNAQVKSNTGNPFRVNAGYHSFDDNMYHIEPDEVNKNDYYIFFVYQMKYTNLRDLNNFLEYYLEKGFENNIQKFKKFLQICFSHYNDIFSKETIKTIKEWTNSKAKKSLGNNSVAKKGLAKIDENEIEPIELTNNNSSQQSKAKDKTTGTEDKIDLNLWNENGKSLFEYLIENYNKAKGNQKYINIFHFLKNTDKVNERKEIRFYYSVDEYKILIKELTNCEWKKTNKPANFQSQLIILNGYYSIWRKRFKEIEIPQIAL